MSIKSRGSSLQVTLIELTLILCVFSGMITGAATGLQYGLVEGLIGCILGAAGGYLCHIALWGFFLVLIKWQEHVRTSYPVCRNGCCHSDDYQHICFTEKLTTQDERLQIEMEGIVVRCKCGVKYLFSKKKRIFMEILPDGSLCPYMYYKPFLGKWELEGI
jgi:hypothetical protein